MLFNQRWGVEVNRQLAIATAPLRVYYRAEQQLGQDSLRGARFPSSWTKTMSANPFTAVPSSLEAIQAKQRSIDKPGQGDEHPLWHSARRAKP
ncbi:hypothetical protein ON010_g5743 [Phytophthora cinnamomi]|nr:hypothetical protein ON010_g5743 [Phytophthora cinnamomi]